MLRPLFADQLPDDDTYDTEFDRMETILGLLAQDEANVRGTTSYNGSVRPLAYWFGRATWRIRQSRALDPVAAFTSELAVEGRRWAPLQAGLFGGDESRADRALTGYGEVFNSVATQQSFR